LPRKLEEVKGAGDLNLRGGEPFGSLSIQGEWREKRIPRGGE